MKIRIKTLQLDLDKKMQERKLTQLKHVIFNSLEAMSQSISQVIIY